MVSLQFKHHDVACHSYYKVIVSLVRDLDNRLSCSRENTFKSAVRFDKVLNFIHAISLCNVLELTLNDRHIMSTGSSIKPYTSSSLLITLTVISLAVRSCTQSQCLVFAVITCTSGYNSLAVPFTSHSSWHPY